MNTRGSGLQTSIHEDPEKGFPMLFLSDSFSQDGAKSTQWGAFIRKNRLTETKVSLQEVPMFLTSFLMPSVRAIQQGEAFEMNWTAPGP